MARVFIVLLCVCLAGVQSRPAPEFDINLDLAPEERFAEVVAHFNSSIHDFYNKFLHSIPAKAILFGLSAKRGKENAGEIESKE